MKTKTIMAGLLGLGLVVAAFSIPTVSEANVTTLGAPGVSGRPMADTTTKARTDSLTAPRGIHDTNVGGSFNVVSWTSTAINITSTAKLNWATDNYAGPYLLNIVNKTAAVGVVWISAVTTTALVSDGTASGTLIPSSGGVTLQVSNLDGITAHVQGLAAAITVNISVSNY